MARPKKTEDGAAPFCPVKATLGLLGRKWTLLLIMELMGGVKRFNELSHALGGVNSRTLRERLRIMEKEQLVSRRVVSHIPPWVEYSLTPKGRALFKAMDDLSHWGRRWMKPPRPAAGKSR